VADDIRNEAERLVAAAIAAVSLAARGLGVPGGRAGGFATGSAECCVCPVCRVIAAMRDPNPDLAEKLSSGAGDLAASVANLLRTLSHTGGPERGGDAQTASEGDEFWEQLRRRARGEPEESDPWHTATTSPAGSDSGATAPQRPAVKKAMAKKAVAKKAKAVPAKVVPAKVVPAKVVPAKVVPAKVVPAKAAAAKATPGAASPTKSAPATSVPTKSVPTKSVPTKAAPTKSVPTKSVPTKAAPTTSVPTKSVPRKAPGPRENG
jgi:hypothetical protein